MHDRKLFVPGPDGLWEDSTVGSRRRHSSRIRNGSRDRNRRIVRTGRTYGQKQGRISKMREANGLYHYWDISLARFEEENDVDI